ncbi:MAG: hypothetical protein EPN69_01500 [Rhodanobacter sp.]|nr:MAG: hypothetical protein EPN69_01500 [Rhodanobacter sp.]TAM42095.1 MAG: hypothetical protein EPN58_04145 [Rhodanobacter sp.]TAN28114.1 MAG: hypothetical protein EPN32_03385 [Rhodanobacter sp.]
MREDITQPVPDMHTLRCRNDRPDVTATTRQFLQAAIILAAWLPGRHWHRRRLAEGRQAVPAP